MAAPTDVDIAGAMLIDTTDAFSILDSATNHAVVDLEVLERALGGDTGTEPDLAALANFVMRLSTRIDAARSAALALYTAERAERKGAA